MSVGEFHFHLNFLELRLLDFGKLSSPSIKTPETCHAIRFLRSLNALC